MGAIRFALALAVLLSHLPPATFKFIGGGVAVQAFFIISGFYMSLVLSGKYQDRWLFYSNRLARLAPVYVVMLVLGGIMLFGLDASATASRSNIVAISNPFTWAVAVIENFVVVGQDLLYWFRVAPDGALSFDASGVTPGPDSMVAWQLLMVPQSWSLSLELVFYAVAPWACRQSTGRLITIALASIALRFAGHLLPVDFATWQGRFFPTVAFLFVFGILAQRTLPSAARQSKLFGWLALAFLLGLIIALPLIVFPAELGRWTVYLAVTVCLPFVFVATGGLRFDRWIGDLSYPIYLCHLVVVGAVLSWDLAFAVPVAIGGTIALSILLFMLVDRPIDGWRQKRVGKLSALRG